MSLLSNRNLAAVLGAELLSLTGSAMTLVASPWFVLIMTGLTARMGQALQHVGIPVVALAIVAGFTAAAAAFSAAVRGAREEKLDAVPTGDLATVLTAEARPD